VNPGKTKTYSPHVKSLPGIVANLTIHIPKAEKRAWPLDFYKKICYNIKKTLFYSGTNPCRSPSKASLIGRPQISIFTGQIFVPLGNTAIIYTIFSTFTPHGYVSTPYFLTQKIGAHFTQFDFL
jgi:hypothetical protein